MTAAPPHAPVAVQSYIVAGGEVVPVRVINDGTAALISQAGHDPSDFMAMRWPTGASRHGRIRVLMHATDIETLRDKLGMDFNLPVQLVLGWYGPDPQPMFDRLYVKFPRNVLWHESGRGVYAVDLVDEREQWDRQFLDFPTRGFNVTLDDKSKFYDDTTDPKNDNDPYTYEQAILLLLDTLAPYIDIDEVSFPQVAGRLDSDLGLRDLFVEHHPVSRILDRLLMLSGHVLVAATHINVDGFRYWILPIETGAETLSGYLTTNGNLGQQFLGGGYLAMPDTSDLPSFLTDALLSNPTVLDTEMPTSVKVVFPTSMKNAADYRFNKQDGTQQGQDFLIGRHFGIVSTTGRPAGFVGNGQEVTLFDSEYAIYDFVDIGGGQMEVQLTNQPTLQTRADTVATSFYGRYSSGAGPMRFRGMVQMVPYTGASMVTWSVVQHGSDLGLWTAVEGDMDDPIFGFTYNQPIKPYGVLSIGDVRAMPRPDGGVVLDSPHTSGGGAGFIHPGKITAVHPNPMTPGINATYDAEAFDDPAIAVTNATPIDRRTNWLDPFLSIDAINQEVWTEPPIDPTDGLRGYCELVVTEFGVYLKAFEYILVGQCGGL